MLMKNEPVERHTLAVLVDNEPGVLARVIGLFSGRGYNIDSLTVSETEHEKHLSRITIVTTGTPMVIEQIRNQLERLVPVHRVVDLTVHGATTESFVFEITGRSDKIDQFVGLMLPLGLVEVSRTGVVAIGRGPEGMQGRADMAAGQAS
jgi:acetolactate synthase-1/3 small subunit